MNKLVLTAIAATTCVMTMYAQPKLTEKNIDEVIKAMTLEEKARLLVGGSNNFFGDQAAVGGEADLVAGAAGTSPAIPRLGIPATVLTDGPAGVRIDPTRKGTSLTDIITGRVNPSGRLTMTWPLAATDHPSTDGYANPQVALHKEGIYVGYRYFDTFNKEVAYPFGYGLSYTTFEFSKPKVKVSDKNVTVQVTVKNTGKVSGKEVAQVYVTAPKGNIEKPAQELKGFAKTRELLPGEQQVLTMQIPVRMLASFDEAGSQWLTDAGQYSFNIGVSSRDIRCTVNAKISRYTEKVSKALAPKETLHELKK